MSDPAIAVEPTSRSVAILGADALLVALPSTPTQLANACFAGGYAEVFPATWGDELIAAGCLEQLESRNGPAIFCACPLVAEQLRGAAELRRFIVPLLSPPVAVARYLRALFADDALRITYIGDCPGADDTSIDERLSPHELMANLAKRGIMPATQRPDVGAHTARDRRRFYSIPGGVPSPQWLGAQWPKRTLVDVHAGDALASLATQTTTRGNTLIDFAPHLGCACAGAVGGTSAQDARKAVIALEPPRADTEIVDASVRVEVSTATAHDKHITDVTWGDFLAALPAALSMHPEGAANPSSHSSSRTAPRRALTRKAALPRAYIAARQNARRDRSAPARTGTTQELKHAARPLSERPRSSASTEITGTRMELDPARRDEITSARPSPWIGRRASHEGMTGPRNVALHRSGLATADRWLLAGLMLASSVLVAVLTSALTVRGMERSSTPLATPTVAARAETIAVAAAPSATPRDTTPIVRPPRATDSVLVASVAAHVDSAPQHEDGGSVAPPPSAQVVSPTSAGSPRLSPMPQRAAQAPPAQHSTSPAKREPQRAERRSLAIAEHVRAMPVAREAAPPPEPRHQPAPITQTVAPSSTTLPSPIASAPVQQTSASSSPVAGGPSASTSSSAAAVSAPASPPVSAPATAPAAAPAAATNNALVLEELRAIHAEIDARKRHMDSLTKALDSLKRATP